MLSERQGCEILKRLFTEGGFTITDDHPLQLDAGVIRLDGYDLAKKVGFEYITDEAQDRTAITGAMLDELERRMANGELFVLLVDEREIGDERDLAFAADGFIAQVKKR
jgi:hypothetical protein